jgi:hypothetical protein
MPRLIIDGQIPGTGSGTGIGEISQLIPFTSNISGTTAPSTGTTGTDFDTLDHPDGSTTGQKFEWQVPGDYDSGDLTVKAVYVMSTSVAGDVVLGRAAEIADVSAGTVDTATYAEANTTVTVPSTLDEPTRSDIFTISEGDFSAGDSIVFLIKRIGANGSDTHTGDWQVIAYEVSYTGQIATRKSVQFAQTFDDTDETAATPGTKDSFDTLDFDPDTINEQKFMVHVPDHWDGASDMHVRAIYAMATSVATSEVRLRVEAEVADVSGGTLTAISPTFQNVDVRTPSDTSVSRTPVLRTIRAADIGAGDAIVIKLKRQASASGDNHTGAMQLIGCEVSTGVVPTAGFTSTLISEVVLFGHDFEVVSGSPTAEQESPDPAGDFETYLKMTGTVASDRVDLTFQGALQANQTTLSSIKIPIKGDGQYQIKVYVDGSGSSNVYTASSLLTAPASRTVTTLTDSDLSAQPTGEKRYIIAIEATVDVGEIVRIGRPLVKQE